MLSEDNDIYLVGELTLFPDVDPGAGEVILSDIPGGDDLFIVRLDSSGNLVWGKQARGAGTSRIYSGAVDSAGNLRISYANDPSVYRALSAVDVLNGSVDLALLEDTVALLGVTATGIGDIVPTPYSGATLGVELHARMCH